MHALNYTILLRNRHEARSTLDQSQLQKGAAYLLSPSPIVTKRALVIGRMANDCIDLSSIEKAACVRLQKRDPASWEGNLSESV